MPNFHFSFEQSLPQCLAEYQTRLQYLESLYRARQEDVALLSQFLRQSPTSSSNSSPVDDTAHVPFNISSVLDSLSPEARSTLKNFTLSLEYPSSLQIPIAYHFLPHLLDDPISLKPSFLISKERTGVNIVLGVHTVKRDNESFLMSTLQSLITNMDEMEQKETLIVVFIGETDMDYISLTAKKIKLRFGSYIENGLIDVVAPSASYYPNFDKLDKIKLKAKPNLDITFLMAYAQSRGIFYVQLEDDIMTKRAFVTSMKKFAIDQTVERPNWVVLDFCDLGFIGKMFKSAELPWLITFFQMFYDKPVDFVLDHYIDTTARTLQKNKKPRTPSVFQHIGLTSPLKAQQKQETLSQQRLTDYQSQLKILESMYRKRQKDVAILSQSLGLSQSPTSDTNNDDDTALVPFNNSAIIEDLSPEARLNLTKFKLSTEFPSSLRMPTQFHFLPHLLDDPMSLQPSLVMSKGRTGVSVVLGVPTVKREKQSYLMSTLRSLITNMDETEQNETLIVVSIGETDTDYLNQTVSQIEECFGSYIDNGLIDVIAASASYYPNFRKLQGTLNHSLERVKWRSKQNLDFAFLMSYGQSKGTFYVQLEDDILTKRSFVTTMKKLAIDKTAENDNWIVLDFCELGFIGKMFKSTELQWLITFFQMFYSAKAVDRLLDDFVHTKARTCNKHHWFHYQPSLFQHVGINSSLKGRLQKFKDSQFGKIESFCPHQNPPASVKTNMPEYKHFHLNRAYNGESYFWTRRRLKAGDMVQFIFNHPISLKRYLFQSGNAEYPSDRFYDTTVEVLPESLNETSPSSYKSTADGYFIVGGFDVYGLSEGEIHPEIGTIKEIRLQVHSASRNWVILSEIHLQDTSTDHKDRTTIAKNMHKVRRRLKAVS